MARPLSAAALTALLAAALLAGCTTPAAVSTAAQPWEIHRQRILDLHEWRLEGKMGYRGNGEGGSAWIDWQQAAAHFDVHLSGPFGSGVTRLHGDRYRATLNEPGRAERSAPTPAELTAELFGWALPVVPLGYWVRGVPDPELPLEAVELNAAGVLSHLRQQGWDLHFEEYRATPIGPLPGRISAGRIDSEAGAVHVTLVVKSWHLNRQRY